MAAGTEPAGEDGARWEEQSRGAERASRALGTLPPVQREAVVLHTIESFSVEEIASIQGVSVSAVKSRLARGRKRLRRYYERRGYVGAGNTPQSVLRVPEAVPSNRSTPLPCPLS